ncbi:MAG: hypothetical protein Hals2KO_37250 [Halioglobus sp.]|jgi:hypothetical protein
MRLWSYFCAFAAIAFGFIFFSKDDSLVESIILRDLDIPGMVDMIPFVLGYTAGMVLLSVVLMALYAYVSLLGAKSHRLVSGKESSAIFAIKAGFVLYAFCIFSFLIHVSANTSEHFANHSNIGSMLLMLLSVPFTLVVLIYYLLSPFAVTYMILAMVPYFVTGIFSITIPSKTSTVAKKHAVSKVPSSKIENELADAMESGIKSDRELVAIIDKMAPVPRFFYTLTYKKKAEKYRKMRELMEAQIEAKDERGKLAHAAHELERSKRNV